MSNSNAKHRLLILGGTTLMIHVVETAKKMYGDDVYVIVTDVDPSSPAKRYADAAYDISTGEVDQLLEMAKAERVNGVFTGYEDFNTSIAVELCQLLNLPFYATKEQIDVTKSKDKFKAACKAHGIRTVPEYSADNVQYPCVVKPTDSYSAKGITICRQPEQLQAAIEYALQFSKSHSYLIEKYMDSDSVDCVNIDYVLNDGHIMVSAIGDKKVKRQADKAPLTSAVFYPSKHIDSYMQTVNEKAMNMFRSLGMKNGTVFIESFYDDEGYAFYEMGYRVGGGQSSILLDRLCDVDYVKMLIHFAFTGSMCSPATISNIDPYRVKYACGLVLLAQPGTVTCIVGMDAVERLDDVVHVTQYLHIGDTVDPRFFGTLGQTFGRIHIVSKTADKMQDTIEKINEVLHAYDENGNEMIVPSHPVY